MKPIVDGIEAQHSDQLIVIRVNIQEAVGRELAPFYAFQYTPTFIFFDAQGRERWRSIGQLDPARVADSLR